MDAIDMYFRPEFISVLETNSNVNNVTKELCRRRRSKKARRRLVRSIRKRGYAANQGAFARKVIVTYCMRDLVIPITRVIDYEGYARKLFRKLEIA